MFGYVCLLLCEGTHTPRITVSRCPCSFPPIDPNEALIFINTKQTLPVAQKTHLFEELYRETIIKNPKRVELFGYR